MKSLQDMSIEELHKHKRKFLDEAEKLKIGPRCGVIAKELGKSKIEDTDPPCEIYHWKQRHLDIKTTYYHASRPGLFVQVYVKYQDRTVLAASYREENTRGWRYTVFTPGNWADILLKKYKEVKELVKEKEKKRIEAERQELIAELTPIE